MDQSDTMDAKERARDARARDVADVIFALMCASPGTMTPDQMEAAHRRLVRALREMQQ